MLTTADMHRHSPRADNPVFLTRPRPARCDDQNGNTVGLGIFIAGQLPDTVGDVGMRNMDSAWQMTLLKFRRGTYINPDGISQQR